MLVLRFLVSGLVQAPVCYTFGWSIAATFCQPFKQLATCRGKAVQMLCSVSIRSFSAFFISCLCSPFSLVAPLSACPPSFLPSRVSGAMKFSFYHYNTYTSSLWSQGTYINFKCLWTFLQGPAFLYTIQWMLFVLPSTARCWPEENSGNASWKKEPRTSHQNCLKIAWYTKDSQSFNRQTAILSLTTFCHLTFVHILIWVTPSIQNKTASPISQERCTADTGRQIIYKIPVWNESCLYLLTAAFQGKFGSSSTKHPPHSQNRCIIYHSILLWCAPYKINQGPHEVSLTHHLEY